MNEKTNLETHVAVCDERYREIFTRLRRIEYVVWAGIVGLIAILADVNNIINWGGGS